MGIELSLLERQIPYHIEGKNSVFNLVEAQSIRAIIELVAGAFSGMSVEERQSKFELIKDMKKAESQYKINELCRVFGISLSSYYYKPITASLADINLMTLIKAISVNSGNT